MDGRLRTYALLATGMMLFGSATPLSKLVVADFPVFSASLGRVVIGAIVLLPFVAGSLGRIRGLSRRDWLVLGGISLVGMFGFTVLLLYGMRRVPGVVGAIVMSTTPAITAAASVAFLADRWTRRKVTAIALSVTGVLLAQLRGADGGTGTDSALGVVLGSLLVLGAVCCEAGYTLIGKLATDRLGPAVTTFAASALAIPLFLVPAALLELPGFDPSVIDAAGWLALFAWGAGTLGLGSILWYSGLQRVEGSVAAGFMGVMPISALIFSYVLLGEPVRLAHVVGFVVVFCGVLLIAREHGSRHAD